MATAEVELVGKSRELNREEIFYTDWGWETLKNNLAFANQSLRELVALNVAILGSSVFLGTGLMPQALRLAMLVAFFGSLTSALLGAMPRSGWADLRVAQMIRAEKLGALKSKLRYLKAACGLLLLAFAIGIFGLAVD